MPDARLVRGAVPRMQQQIECAGRPRSARKLHAADVVQREQQRWLHAALGLSRAVMRSYSWKASRQVIRNPCGNVVWTLGASMQCKTTATPRIAHPLEEAESCRHGKQPSLAHLRPTPQQLRTCAHTCQDALQ